MPSRKPLPRSQQPSRRRIADGSRRESSANAGRSARPTVEAPRAAGTLVRQILDTLLACDRSVFSLDDLGDAIGTLPVTTDDIGRLLDELERAGRSISVQAPPTREELMLVTKTARALERELGRKPSPSEIAQRSELEDRVVRAVLLLGSVMGR